MTGPSLITMVQKTTPTPSTSQEDNAETSIDPIKSLLTPTSTTKAKQLYRRNVDSSSKSRSPPQFPLFLLDGDSNGIVSRECKSPRRLIGDCISEVIGDMNLDGVIMEDVWNDNNKDDDDDIYEYDYQIPLNDDYFDTRRKSLTETTTDETKLEILLDSGFEVPSMDYYRTATTRQKRPRRSFQRDHHRKQNFAPYAAEPSTSEDVTEMNDFVIPLNDVVKSCLHDFSPQQPQRSCRLDEVTSPQRRELLLDSNSSLTSLLQEARDGYMDIDDEKNNEAESGDEESDDDHHLLECP